MFGRVLKCEDGPSSRRSSTARPPSCCCPASCPWGARGRAVGGFSAGIRGAPACGRAVPRPPSGVQSIMYCISECQSRSVGAGHASPVRHTRSRDIQPSCSWPSASTTSSPTWRYHHARVRTALVLVPALAALRCRRCSRRCGERDLERRSSAPGLIADRSAGGWTFHRFF